MFDSGHMTAKLGSVCSITSAVGSQFAIMDGNISGKMLETNDVKKVMVQSLRFSDWEADLFCQAKYRLLFLIIIYYLLLKIIIHL